MPYCCSAGFAVNRVFFPYTMAACMLVDIGLDPYSIDKVIAAGFGMPMGPFRWDLLSPGCFRTELECASSFVFAELTEFSRMQHFWQSVCCL